MRSRCLDGLMGALVLRWVGEALLDAACRDRAFRCVGRLPTTVAVGLGFDLQLVDSLPVEAHDQQLDYVVTETRFIPCRT